MISIVAIIGKNRELGKNNQLIWNIPEDMQRFRKITYGHPVIMGRKTYESIGKKLKGRNNIIITKNDDFQASGCMVVYSLDKAIEYAQQMDQQEIFVIGGQQIYEQSLPRADKLYLTVVEETAEADSYFPEYPEFTNIIYKKEIETENGIKYKFLELTK